MYWLPIHEHEAIPGVFDMYGATVLENAKFYFLWYIFCGIYISVVQLLSFTSVSKYTFIYSFVQIFKILKTIIR